ncbi:DUF885 domain-containing protein [Haematomicrobium sanguinis]|uniref:DUF885 domain-containing protein n=1 Tax=Haematomicrobium sanguinis TaxID=479106 RepID=UPI000A057D6A|nr:DUF885 domain-containing protein [Haematomicrobium sanguinis]
MSPDSPAAPKSASAAPPLGPDTALATLIETDRAQLEKAGLVPPDTTDPFAAALPRVDAESDDERARITDATARTLATIDRDALSTSARIDAEVFDYLLRVRADMVRTRAREWPLNSDATFWTGLNAFAPASLADRAMADRYLNLLAQVPRFFAENLENLRAGVARGFGPARPVMTGAANSLEALARSTGAEATPYWKGFAALAASRPGTATQKVLDSARKLIEGTLIPLHRDAHEFLTADYLPHLPESLAATWRPGGEDYYRSLIFEATTEDWDPEQLHALGLEQVELIRAEMEQLAANLGHRGDLPGLLAFMKTDSQFYARTPEELLHFAAWQAKKFDGVAHHYFPRAPRRRFGIFEPAPEIAPTYTAGRGGPGLYIVNTYDLQSRPLYGIPALTLHEGAPGHAWQIPFAQEAPEVSDFRKKVYMSAYGEGWALYCERLGEDMGIYANDYERMGMLSYQMWRAVRLVVDPGIHALGWTRDRAVAYLGDNTALSAHEVGTEVDRYITWPAQATSYYPGMLRIQAARRRAEDALGDRFSLPDFHHAALTLGSVPMPTFDREIDRYVASALATPVPQS